jgi:multisubunit Na+/H+ antiporter MnhG subunit
VDIIRKILGGLFAMLGSYYCVLGVLTLVRLPSVTARWILRSGDPDFKYDDGMFMLWIAVGAVLVGVFGYRTAIKGVATARGGRDSWLALAIGAPLLHWFWFLYRTVGNGVLDRAAQASAQRTNGLRFGTICIAYLAMWIVTRSPTAEVGPANDRMQPTALGL